MSAKRTESLKLAIIECRPEQKKIKLISLCKTRWVKRHDLVLLFKEILQSINLALLKFFYFESYICSMTHNLSEMLQKKNIDLSQAMKSVTNVLELLKKQRSNVEDNF